jgi:peptidyl-prolyl cis-trans isomerase B (cyclophilin B)
MGTIPGGRALALACVLAVLIGAGGAVPAAYRQIVALESRRSLGDGRLAMYLESPDVAVATRAALGIGRTKQPAGEALLAAHLRDGRNQVRAMSVYSLGLLTTGGHADALIVDVTDPSSAVRVAALDAIARYEAAHLFSLANETAALGGIESALAHDEDPIVRARAATALVEFRDGSHADEAAAALAGAFRNDRDQRVVWHAMWSIYRGFALKVNRHLIVAALKSRDELIRIEAVRALGKYKDPSLVAVVRPLLSDPSWHVQEQAGETIRLLQGKKQTEHWTSIPSYVHVPPVQPDPLAALPATPRTPASGKPQAPSPDDASYDLTLDPTDAASMTSPASGPHPRVRIATTKGNVYVVLYPEWAPLTVANFLNLANRGYYDGNRWFRIVPDFVVQTGDPNDNGEGDAGYTIGAEENPLEQDSYVISMGMNYDDKTNMPIRDSAGTQYYITLSPQLHLDRDFTVYGSVTAGADVLGRLVESDRVVRIERIADAVLP